jgi:hypothetical protein
MPVRGRGYDAIYRIVRQCPQYFQSVPSDKGIKPFVLDHIIKFPHTRLVYLNWRGLSISHKPSSQREKPKSKGKRPGGDSKIPSVSQKKSFPKKF